MSVSLFQQYRPALLFILKFVGLYIILNTSYGVFINKFSPLADPVTVAVADHVSILLQNMYADVSIAENDRVAFVGLVMDGRTIVNVFEGCNGINVAIVYVSFIFASSTIGRSSLYYILVGFAIIYLVNLFRVSLLFIAAIEYPSQLYFFHKYFFTAVIYAFVFVLWFLWIKGYRRHDSGSSRTA